MSFKGGVKTQQGIHQHRRQQASVEEFPEALEILGYVSEEGPSTAHTLHRPRGLAVRN